MKLALLLLAFSSAACGYSEAEMQAQRDKSDQLSSSLDRLATDSANVRAKLSDLVAQNEQLSAQLAACTKHEPPPEPRQ